MGGILAEPVAAWSSHRRAHSSHLVLIGSSTARSAATFLLPSAARRFLECPP
jgi:hypothetical protein